MGGQRSDGGTKFAGTRENASEAGRAAYVDAKHAITVWLMGNGDRKEDLKLEFDGPGGETRCQW